VLAYVCALEGDGSTAHDLIEQLVEEGLDSIAEFSTGLATLSILCDAAAELGDADLGRRLVPLVEPYAELPVMPSLSVICLGPVRRSLAMARMAQGDLSGAIDDLRLALLAARRLGNRPLEAMICAQSAAAMQRRGDSIDEQEATDLWARGIAMADAMGMATRAKAWRAAQVHTLGVWPDLQPLEGTLEIDGTSCRFELAGHCATLSRTTGIDLLALLVERPDVDVPAVELAAVGLADDVASSEVVEAPALDATALRAYRQRLSELDVEIERADRRGDAVRSQRATAERTAITDQLRKDSGLGGRPRRLADDVERCRDRVTKAIRRALRRVTAVDGSIGQTLDSRVRTGHRCRYEPGSERPVFWTVRRMSDR
jgi:hypothetical protein